MPKQTKPKWQKTKFDSFQILPHIFSFKRSLMVHIIGEFKGDDCKRIHEANFSKLQIFGFGK